MQNDKNWITEKKYINIHYLFYRRILFQYYCGFFFHHQLLIINNIFWNNIKINCYSNFEKKNSKKQTRIN